MQSFRRFALSASVCLYTATASFGGDRLWVQTSDTSVATPKPEMLMGYQGESIKYSLNTTKAGRPLMLSPTNSYCLWSVTSSTNALVQYVYKVGTIANPTNGAFRWSLTPAESMWPTGRYDSAVYLIVTNAVTTNSTIVVASRCKIEMRYSGTAGYSNVVGVVLPDYLSTVIRSNQMGSGATWNGSQWVFAGGSGGVGSETQTWWTVTNRALQADFADTSNRVVSLEGVQSATNVTGGILTFANRMVGLTQAAISNAMAGVYALAGHVHAWTEITGLGTAATNSADAFATAAQGALADSALQGGETNALLDLAGTRAMTGNSVTLARDVKSRSATSVGYAGAAFGYSTTADDYGAAFGHSTTAGNAGAAFGAFTTADDYGAAFGDSTTAGGYGAAFGDGTTAGIYGAAFGYSTTAGNAGAAFGFATTAGDYGFGAGWRGKGGTGSFIFADSTDANFDRTAYTNWFSVRASGGAYFATPDLTVTGTVTAASFSGDGSGLTNFPNAVIPEAQGNIAGTWAVDFTAGGVQSGVQTGAVTNVTFTVSSTNAESALVYQFFSNGDSVTWNTNTTTFVGGTAPTLTSNEWNRLFISGYRGRYHVGAAGSAP